MSRPWEANPTAVLSRRLGKSAQELGMTDEESGCPDIWELSDGDIAIVGRDMTVFHAAQLPAGVTIAVDERLVVIPREMLVAAREDIPDA